MLWRALNLCEQAGTHGCLRRFECLYGVLELADRESLRSVASNCEVGCVGCDSGVALDELGADESSPSAVGCANS